MVDFELTNPVDGFLLGIELLDGTTEDLEEGVETQISIFSIGLIFFKINFLTIKK